MPDDTQTKTAPAGSVKPVVRRPADATHDALRKCLHWLDACRELGWSEDVMRDLENLFWEYHDSDGIKKTPNTELSEPGATGTTDRKTP